jgi:hypothetical protein
MPTTVEGARAWGVSEAVIDESLEKRRMLYGKSAAHASESVKHTNLVAKNRQGEDVKGVLSGSVQNVDIRMST